VLNSPDQGALGYQPFKFHDKPGPTQALPATPNISALAYALGMAAKTISTIQEVEPTLVEMFRSDGPCLVEAKLGKFN
jgi:thiamine pyrophosphate-dependent acetolactate synthase large subunit-like protein